VNGGRDGLPDRGEVVDRPTFQLQDGLDQVGEPVAHRAR
jgi:hypothetical protein